MPVFRQSSHCHDQGVRPNCTKDLSNVGPPQVAAEMPCRWLPDSQWRSAQTTNAIERLHEELKRRIKTQTVLPSAETAAMLSWALLAAGQITMRKVDGWQTLAEKPTVQCIGLAA